MPLVRTGELVGAAWAARRGVAALNVITIEHAEAVVAAAETAGASAIMQISQNALRYHRGLLRPIAAACVALAEGSSAPIALHLDHIEDLTIVEQAAAAGFSSVMFDAGALPYADNVELTRRAVASGHRDGLWVEAELGYVGGKSGAPASAHAPDVRTDPAEAGAFVDATGADGLAVAVGTSHAMTEKRATPDRALISRLKNAVPVPLVLHGTSGVGDDDLSRVIQAGIVKVNVGTTLNMAMTGAIRRCLDEDRDLIDPRKYLEPARDAMTRAVCHLLEVMTATPTGTP